MPMLHPALNWGCFSASAGFGKTFPLPPGRAAADPMYLFSSAPPLDVEQDEVDKSSKRPLYAAQGQDLGYGISPCPPALPDPELLSPPCSGMLSPASTALRPPCWPSSASTEILSYATVEAGFSLSVLVYLCASAPLPTRTGANMAYLWLSQVSTKELCQASAIVG